MLDRPEETWFDVGLMHKDIRLAIATGAERSVVLPSASVAGNVLSQAIALGYEHRDIAAVHEVLAISDSSQITPQG